MLSQGIAQNLVLIFGNEKNGKVSKEYMKKYRSNPGIKQKLCVLDVFSDNVFCSGGQAEMTMMQYLIHYFVEICKLFLEILSTFTRKF